jgi:glycerophosphoryl diester phosphodiesterase
MGQSELLTARLFSAFATLILMLIYAHRGASADYPELTESAYTAAINQGADGFECDLRLTRDEIPVLWHNASMLERAGNHGLIAEMNFADVQRAYPQVLSITFSILQLRQTKECSLRLSIPSSAETA